MTPATDLIEALTEKLESLQTLVKRKGLGLKTRLPEACPQCADADQLCELLAAIIGIALDKGCTGEKIAVSVCAVKNGIELDILLRCGSIAPPPCKLRADLKPLRPLLKKLGATLRVSNPMRNGLLFSLRITEKKHEYLNRQLVA